MAVNTTFFQLVAAFFVAFILAHVVTKYFERFERFPPPLVSPGAGAITMQQGRDYIPHRFTPTAPPGPPSPMPSEVDPAPRSSVPPAPSNTLTTAIAAPASTNNPSEAPALPYAMTNDDYLSFLVTQQPR